MREPGCYHNYFIDPIGVKCREPVVWEDDPKKLSFPGCIPMRWCERHARDFDPATMIGLDGEASMPITPEEMDRRAAREATLIEERAANGEITEQERSEALRDLQRQCCEYEEEMSHADNS